MRTGHRAIHAQENVPYSPYFFIAKGHEKNTHGLSQKIQGTCFKTSALYFKIYALYFSSFGMAEKQQLTKVDFLPLFE